MKDLILDDLNKISKIDKYDQIGKFENLSNQIKKSFDIVDSYDFEKLFKINNIIFGYECPAIGFTGLKISLSYEHYSYYLGFAPLVGIENS